MWRRAEIVLIVMQQNIKIWLIIATVLYGLSIFMSIPMIGMSAMLFDAPGSQNDPGVWAIFYALLLFPLTAILAIIFMWVFIKRKPKVAFVVSLLPFIHLLIFSVIVSAL